MRVGNVIKEPEQKQEKKMKQIDLGTISGGIKDKLKPKGKSKSNNIIITEQKPNETIIH